MSATAEELNLSDHIRQVTDDEIAHYQEHGWAYLPELISRDLAARVLDHVKQLTGLELDEVVQGSTELDPKFLGRGSFRIDTMPRLQDEFIKSYVTSRPLGEAAARLTGIRPLRLVTDTVLYKLPSWTGSGEPTRWHQDLPNMPLDRPGGIQIWMALCEITPEMGSMQHLSRSQREGRLVASTLVPPDQRKMLDSYEGLVELFPQLKAYHVSEAEHFQPGDALAHDSLTLHYAQENHTSKVRWAYTSYRVPADVCYTGNPPSPWLDGLGLEVGMPMDHELLPIVVE